MSWFKDRKDSGDTNADAIKDGTKMSSPENLSPAARSFDDARRALRASINLENDQDTPDSKPETTPSPITPPIPSEPAESTSSELTQNVDVENTSTTVTSSPPNDQIVKPSVTGEAKTDLKIDEEIVEEFPPLVDPTRAKDIQSILSRIGQVNLASEAEAVTKPKADPDAMAGNVEVDVPPPPAFTVRPDEQKNTRPIKTPELEKSVEVKVPLKSTPSLPPMGTMSDPTLGKATSIPASLSTAIKEANPQVEESAIPEFLHESISNTTADMVAKPLTQKSDDQETEVDKVTTAIEASHHDRHIEAMIKTSEAAPKNVPTANNEIEEKEKITSDHSNDHITSPQNETPLEESVIYEAPKQRARVISDELGLEIHNLGKTYKKTPVLKDVSLNVKRGEAVGLLGPNGAGKTTCFYMVCGLIPADFGSISLDGQDITELPMYRRARMGIGYLPQEASIFRGLTVAQNVRAVLEGVEKNRDKREAMLDSLLDEFSISHLRRSPAVALSGGERRRLEIARALASQPHFILLDEPLAGIDPIAVRDIRELVSHLKDRGLGVLITDHNVRETLGIVDRAYILHEGRVLMEGVPDEIIRNQEVRRVYLGDEFSR